MLYASRPFAMQCHEADMENLKRLLLSFQCDNSLKEEFGGFLYGTDPDGVARSHVNTWCTLLVLQALWMHEEFVLRKRPITIECFV